MDSAIDIVQSADIVVVIGTSLQVYPAAGLMYYASKDCKVFYIDPNPNIQSTNKLIVVPKTASAGMKELIEKHF